MSSDDDDLIWRLGARHGGHDYHVFKTAFVDATHPQTGAPKVFSLIEATDWVNIIALTRDDHVVLLKQYRPGIDQVCIEIPGGMVDPGEAPEVAAPRELEEETGYTAKTWHRLGVVAPNPAIMNNRLHSYLALDAELTTPPRPDGGEVLRVYTAPLAEVQEMLRDGRIDHALILAAFAHLAVQTTALRRP